VRGFLGGQKVNLACARHQAATAVWWHPGAHPAFGTHIRFGRLADGRWYVQHTSFPSIEYAFRRRDDAELAVVELMELRRDGRWVVQREPRVPD
jgi:hypothetical protein